MSNNERAGHLACLALFVVLATLNSGGYRYGASDQAFYAAAPLVQIDPALFPRDGPLIAAQAKLTRYDETIAALVRLTGLSLPNLFVILYAATLILLASAGWRIAILLFRSPWVAAGVLGALTLRHQISKSGTNTLEGYFHPRQLAFAFGAWAIVGVLRGRFVRAAVLVGAAWLLHPTTAMWFAVWVGVAALVEHPRLRVPAIAVALAGTIVAAWALTSGPLAGRLGVMDPEWLETIATKDYLFPLEWPIDAWLVNLAYAPLIFWLHSRRASAGTAVPHERALVWGCLALTLVFLVALPLNAMRVAIAIQLQPSRIFWMLDFLAVIYAAAALCRSMWGPASAGPLLLACLSLTRGTYVTFFRVPPRPAIEIALPKNDFGTAMAWARASTPPTSGWLADPMHAFTFGMSLRVAAERDVLVEAVKDAAIGMYDRDVAMRTRDRVRAVGDYQTLTADRARALAAQYDLDYCLITRPLDLPLAFQSGEVRIYKLK